MTAEEFKDKMSAIRDSKDFDMEESHAKADELMCDLLTELGYGDGIKVYDDMPKWYA